MVKGYLSSRTCTLGMHSVLLHAAHSVMVVLQKEDAAVETVKKALKVVEGYLSSRTFLVGERITLADIVGVANTFYGFTNVSLGHALLILETTSRQQRSARHRLNVG